jgi:hypothetical protein
VLPLLRDTSPLSQLNELIDNTSSVILHVDANQAKMKSSQAKPKCFRCWFKGAEVSGHDVLQQMVAQNNL